jgi:DNA-binding HxlR family transcriptional regulator
MVSGMRRSLSLEIKPTGEQATRVPRVCSITDALALVGDRYALLIVRELRYGRTRFTQLLNGTGAPRDVLTRRLRELEEADIVERRLYSERPPRYEYVLTEAGEELHPVLLQLKEWGDRHLNAGAEPVIFRHTCGAEFHATTVCEACRKPIAAGDLTVAGGTHPVDATL